MKMEGKVGQKLDDLVYVKRIALKGEAAGVLGSIGGTVRLPAGEKLVGVIAIHCQDDTSLSAELAGNGAFKFTDCTQGAYDLVVLSDRAIYAGFSAEKAAGGAPARRGDAEGNLRLVEERPRFLRLARPALRRREQGPRVRPRAHGARARPRRTRSRPTRCSAATRCG